MAILKIEDLSKSFGGLKAVSHVNINVEKGELIGLIGPNGAGKTTIFNLLTGVYVPTSGKIELKNDKTGDSILINGLKPYITSSFGISRTFQNIRLFRDLSVLDNLRIAMHKRVKYNVFSAIFRTKAYRECEKIFYENAMAILDFVGLADKRDELADNLPYGEQRKLEIARAVATGASVIFLDEPAAGMNPSETEELRVLIEDLRKKYELTVILIEHDMKFVMEICERIYVLDFGTIIAEGTPEEIKNNDRVIKAYLGEEA
ncbi:ABC transporter ATP-binding protein [Anaerofustis stercorihominis]|uniref:ABC transporter, ATP-binding protein n=2 Tax=Anaerofustis stercorihominis TaxID=214853 RepID=B1CAQ8_9FIRM|nr:ABC transporter ATP-binding protein [Anaerofustis stercorihominis]EDS71355.1 ABC transporter, ATP-binding protein [Anaerofustis stercorihominis DSM 17244]MCQ4794752.1 ABC transporter ATP-binding protein [Anaerofustis stercorihominis]MCR2033373.1 ABC transporter ATP-binding protein [Anaerofustis stercorihominis]RGD73900.1 ABC transporter ATP-binding protein [Anaerofustis stercorihominis]